MAIHTWKSVFFKIATILLVQNASGSSIFDTKLSLDHLRSLDPQTKSNIAEVLVKSIVPFYFQYNPTSSINESEFQQTPHLKDVLSKLPLETSPTCISHLTWFITEILEVLDQPEQLFDDKAVWALQMADAWGKIPEGILSGHLNTYGAYDQCVEIRSPGLTEANNTQNYDTTPFRGKYCWTYVIPSEYSVPSESGRKQDAVSPIELIDEIRHPGVTLMLPSLATCIPSTCNTEDYALFIDFLATLLNIQVVPYRISCGTNEREELDVGATVMLTIVCIMLALVLIGTILDPVISSNKNLKNLKKNVGIQALLAFSLLTNIRKWANTSGGEGGFGCIHGMRFLSTCWVILSHTMYVISLQPPSWNLIEIKHIYDRHWSFYVVLNAYFSVDTFFTMSGLLAAYGIMKGIHKMKGRVSFMFPMQLYLHRFLRLTPTYALLLGILGNLYKYLGSGPRFIELAEFFQKNCRRYWWHNILYINNIVWYEFKEGEAMCEGESWYIANDMQFFILCPLFMIVLYKWRKIGISLLAAATFASIITPGIYVGVKHLNPTAIIWKQKKEDEFVYHRPWHRIGPYFIGMWMGWILFQLDKKPVKLPKWSVALGWALSTATALALIFGVMPYYKPSHNLETTESAIRAGFYAGLSKVSWGLVICWIIFACSKGYGGVVNEFLSWSAFIPLGRLTFCVYLSSLSIQYLWHLTIRQPLVFEMYNMVNIVFSHIVMCFLVGFFLTMIFESPFIILEKILLGGGGGSRPKKEIVEDKVPQSEDNENNNGQSVQVQLHDIDLTKDTKTQ